MIVEMKKITLLVTAKHRDDALKKLRKLGVIHIHNIKSPASDDLTYLESELDKIDKALSIIIEKEDLTESADITEAPNSVKEILSLDKEQKNTESKLEEKNEILRWFEPWGNVSYTSIEELKKAGIFIRLYSTDKSTLKKLPADKMVYVVGRDKYNVHLALVSTSKDDQLDLKEEFIPKTEKHSVQQEIASIENELEQIQRKLDNLASARPSIKTYKEEIEKRCEFAKVKYGMAEEESISYLQGFCPNESTDQLKKLSTKEDWAYIIEDPDDLNEVPTLVRNPRWIRIINPVFKFMGTLPGYDEFDVSFWFLLFFSIFFAMLIGDAGYGFVFLLLTIFAQRKSKNIPNEQFLLLYVLSGATIIWGAITGTWFGFEKISRLPFFSSLIIDQINSFVDTNQTHMMYITFVIGVIHLSIAHGITALKFINSLRALAQIGWILIMWGLFFLAGNLVLEKPFPGIAVISLVVGAVLIVLFSNPQKNLLKGILTSLADLPLSIISSFSDIVSYLRLFAVGYATVVVASSFNNMAIGSGIDNLASGLGAAIILVFGHSLNILLGIMAVVVHGIRLNMLEFSGHLNMQWSGKPYEPFKE